ncbi:hypothetical protein M3Y98_00898100 [Aphelenchoides besseyi]|nr:hypothetical protein M3Y98_00898100 [Aphelenchoides besseyi]
MITSARDPSDSARSSPKASVCPQDLADNRVDGVNLIVFMFLIDRLISEMKRLFIFFVPVICVFASTPPPNHVVLNERRKHIDADSAWLDKTGAKVDHVSLDASDKEKVLVDLLDRNKQLSASSHGNIAAAQIEGGERAQVQRFGDKGGLAQAAGHKAQLRLNEGEGERHAHLKADGEYELDTVAEGSLKDPKDTNFKATNDRFDFNLKPETQQKDDGTGTLSFVDRKNGTSGKYAYTISQNGRRTDAQISAHDIGRDSITSSLFGRRDDKYHCTAETPGISQCYDAQGRSAGKVVADKNGNTIVYNDKGTEVISDFALRSFLRRSNRFWSSSQDKRNVAIISKNLFIARLKNMRRSTCCREITGYDCVQGMKLANPQFSHPSQRDGDGNLAITWPDCFDMSIEVTLPAGKQINRNFFKRNSGVHINRLAMKLDVSIQPIGKLRCMDVATCGNSHKLKLLENTDGNLCRATEDRTYRLTVKLCPPPEDPEFTLCSTFSKSVWQKDYWQKEGAVDVWMKFYERGPNRAELEKQFFTELDNPLLGKAFKLAMIGEWLTANGLDVSILSYFNYKKLFKQGSYTPTNSELLEYWVSKRDPDRLLTCEHAVIDYEIEGAKVKTNLLFEAATTANSLPNIFKDKKCAAYERLQENRFQQEVQEYKKTAAKGSILSGLGNLFRQG